MASHFLAFGVRLFCGAGQAKSQPERFIRRQAAGAIKHSSNNHSALSDLDGDRALPIGSHKLTTVVCVERVAGQGISLLLNFHELQERSHLRAGVGPVGAGHRGQQPGHGEAAAKFFGEFFPKLVVLDVPDQQAQAKARAANQEHQILLRGIIRPDLRTADFEWFAVHGPKNKKAAPLRAAPMSN